MYDYFVIGLGIAGIALCETLEAEGRDFLVFDAGSEKAATAVAGGIYNPVVLKRFKMAWKADEQLPMAQAFYPKLAEKLGVAFHEAATVVRRLGSAEEANDWFQAADKPGLREFLDPRLLRNENPGIHAAHGFGRVQGAGKVNTTVLLEAYRNHLEERGRLVTGHFDPASMALLPGQVSYQDKKARRVVFCSGIALGDNPYFKYLPLRGNKGEYLKVRIPGLREEKVIKAGVFLIPEGGDLYTVGATYSRGPLSREPTEEAREYLLAKLRSVVSLPVEVIDQTAGIRPTVPDRRPLLGQHPAQTGLYLLNGFGSRGLMIAPWAARQLVRFMEYGEPLPDDVDLQRFTRKWFRPSS